MAKIASSIIDLIGKTPLVRLNNVTDGCVAEVIGKCEFFNPLSSVKDRTALGMILSAEEKGQLQKGGVIIEATSGNTGIGLAFVGRLKGYRVILTMPDSMSLERRKLLKILGAEIELTPGHLGMKGAIDRAEDLAKEHGNAIVTHQFDNEANPEIHRTTTAPELWEGTEGKIDLFVAGIGTGGTIVGVADYIKPLKPDFKTIAVEPSDSAILSGKEPGPHMIQGIGAGFKPANLKDNSYDDVIQISNDEAMTMSRRLAKEEGLLVGISSGANVAAAIKLAKQPEHKGKMIVTMLCDSGERYLSTSLFDDDSETR